MAKSKAQAPMPKAQMSDAAKQAHQQMKNAMPNMNMVPSGKMPSGKMCADM